MIADQLYADVVWFNWIKCLFECWKCHALSELMTLFCCMMSKNSLMNLIMSVELCMYNLKVDEMNISWSFQKVRLSSMSFARLIYSWFDSTLMKLNETLTQ